jgi:hypothetical protein
VLWQTTVAGNALAQARIGSSMPRARAEALLNQLIGRVEDVNADPEGLVWTETVDLFGSLAHPDVPTVGDVDVRASSHGGTRATSRSLGSSGHSRGTMSWPPPYPP